MPPAFGMTAGLAELRGDEVGDPLRVGVLLDINGGFSEHRKRQLYGVQQQASLINTGQWGTGFRSVELVVRRSDSDEAIGELVDQEQVQALIASPGPTTSDLIFTASAATKAPLIFCTPGQPPVRPHVFRTGVSPQQVVLRLMQSLRAYGLHAAGMLIHDRLATPGYWDLCRRLGAEHGVDVVAAESYPLADVDADPRPQLTQILAAKPDVIALQGVPPFGQRAVRTARELGWTDLIYCGPGAGSAVFVDGAGDAAEGVRVVAPWILRPESAPPDVPNRSTMIKFKQAYEQNYGTVGVHAACGADAVALLSRAFHDTDDRTLARLALEQTVYDGVTGQFRTALDNHTGLPDNVLTIFAVHNGGWVLTPS